MTPTSLAAQMSGFREVDETEALALVRDYKSRRCREIHLRPDAVIMLKGLGWSLTNNIRENELVPRRKAWLR